jgi:hypothetical protein
MRGSFKVLGCLRAAYAVTLVLAVPALLLLLSAPRAAHGHAVMIQPKSRPWYDYLLNYNYNPHAVFAGGAWHVPE